MKNCVCTFVTSIILAIVLFVFDSILHGILLMDAYVQTPHLWRGNDEMSDYLSFNVAIYLVSAILIVTLFKEFVLKLDNKQLFKNCLKAGLLIGALIGVVLLGFYAYMPISFGLALAWFAGSLIHGLFIALILYLFNKNKSE